ncbi:MAG: CopG family transcriptional regulator [Gammaproteobacteria bacterium]|nr:CopG family transcriptional regulator [Gammaproteobacteria bacterium]
MAANHRVSVNLTKQEYQDLAGLAEKYRVSMAWLSRQAISDYVERHLQEPIQLPLPMVREGRAEYK